MEREQIDAAFVMVAMIVFMGLWLNIAGRQHYNNENLKSVGSYLLAGSCMFFGFLCFGFMLR